VISAIPKPLLVVVIVLLVLGIAGCGMGLLGGGRCKATDTTCKDNQNAELSSGGITSFLKGLIPEPPPVSAATLDPAACAPLPPSSTTNLAFGSSCKVAIGPTDDLRRRFRLRVSPGTASITVTQDVSGNTQTQTQTVPGDGGDTIEVVVGRRSAATITIGCISGTCGLSVP
jgi:hypothetical protein